MIDHISIPVRELKASARFYDALLKPLGMTRVREAPHTVGYGKSYAEFWLNERPHLKPLPEDSGLHICLRAPDAAAVDAFHAAALAAGARSDGAPGKRPQYTDHYYAAFICDWDGNRIEAVTFLRDAAT
jgi:catechol 2,3-dioxygenase-like lactoylglutathione lyase family enzyme